MMHQLNKVDIRGQGKLCLLSKLELQLGLDFILEAKLDKIVMTTSGAEHVDTGKFCEIQFKLPSWNQPTQIEELPCQVHKVRKQRELHFSPSHCNLWSNAVFCVGL